jgi:hypothetical protein
MARPRSVTKQTPCCFLWALDTDEKVSLISSSFMAPAGSLMRVAFM